MADAHARLKELVSRHVRDAEHAWRQTYGPDAPFPDWPRHIYRVLCGHIFPATGDPEPCSQVLGIALPGPLFEKIAITQLAVQHAEDGSIPDPTAWFLTASRALRPGVHRLAGRRAALAAPLRLHAARRPQRACAAAGGRCGAHFVAASPQKRAGVRWPPALTLLRLFS
jgi:hypothetical protein